MGSKKINHSFNRVKKSNVDVDAWLKENKLTVLDCSDNTGLIYSMYPPQYRKRMVAASKHKARKKSEN